MRTKNHFYWECNRCDKTYPAKQDADECESSHNYCKDCDRHFVNENALKMVSSLANSSNLPRDMTS